jgi:hypothetical protein
VLQPILLRRSSVDTGMPRLGKAPELYFYVNFTRDPQRDVCNKFQDVRRRAYDEGRLQALAS